MKKYIIILFAFIGSFASAQDYDFQDLCIACAEQQGFYCGDDPANWTQYSPEGCVPNGEGGMFYLNDGWEDCADGSDEAEAVPTPIESCGPIGPPPCDTVYVDVPVIEYIYETDTIVEYETIFDTIVETEYVYNIVIDTVEVEVFVPEYVYITDTVYAEVLDTLFIDVVEYVDVIVYDTVIEIEYVEFIEYVTEYVDCYTNLPCNSSIQEVIDKSLQNSVIYNIMGQPIKQPESIYIEGGKIKYLLK
tara:strand:+ start:41 stop:781 length:741 start_codon:yes stop_codon:yes gene_type:complete